MPQLVTSVDREWITDTRKISHLCPNGRFDGYDVVSPILRAAMMPWRHPSYLFLKKEDVFSLRRLVCLFGFVVVIDELSMTNGGKLVWEKPMREYGSVLPMVYMSAKQAEMKHTGYAILDCMVSLIFSLSHTKCS